MLRVIQVQIYRGVFLIIVTRSHLYVTIFSIRVCVFQCFHYPTSQALISSARIPGIFKLLIGYAMALETRGTAEFYNVQCKSKPCLGKDTSFIYFFFFSKKKGKEETVKEEDVTSSELKHSIKGNSLDLARNPYFPLNPWINIITYLS